MTATLQARLREAAEVDWLNKWLPFVGASDAGRYAGLLQEAATELSRLESACESAVVEIDRLRRQLEARQAASSPIPSGPVVVYGELEGYFGER